MRKALSCLLSALLLPWQAPLGALAEPFISFPPVLQAAAQRLKTDQRACDGLTDKLRDPNLPLEDAKRLKPELDQLAQGLRSIKRSVEQSPVDDSEQLQKSRLQEQAEQAALRAEVLRSLADIRRKQIELRESTERLKELLERYQSQNPPSLSAQEWKQADALWKGLEERSAEVSKSLAAELDPEKDWGGREPSQDTLDLRDSIARDQAQRLERMKEEWQELGKLMLASPNKPTGQAAALVARTLAGQARAGRLSDRQKQELDLRLRGLQHKFAQGAQPADLQKELNRFYEDYGFSDDQQSKSMAAIGQIIQDYADDSAPGRQIPAQFLRPMEAVPGAGKGKGSAPRAAGMALLDDVLSQLRPDLSIGFLARQAAVWANLRAFGERLEAQARSKKLDEVLPAWSSGLRGAFPSGALARLLDNAQRDHESADARKLLGLIEAMEVAGLDPRAMPVSELGLFIGARGDAVELRRLGDFVVARCKEESARADLGRSFLAELESALRGGGLNAPDLARLGALFDGDQARNPFAVLLQDNDLAEIYGRWKEARQNGGDQERLLLELRRAARLLGEDLSKPNSSVRSAESQWRLASRFRGLADSVFEFIRKADGVDRNDPEIRAYLEAYERASNREGGMTDLSDQGAEPGLVSLAAQARELMDKLPALRAHLEAEKAEARYQKILGKFTRASDDPGMKEALDALSGDVTRYLREQGFIGKNEVFDIGQIGDRSARAQVLRLAAEAYRHYREGSGEGEELEQWWRTARDSLLQAYFNTDKLYQPPASARLLEAAGGLTIDRSAVSGAVEQILDPGILNANYLRKVREIAGKSGPLSSRERELILAWREQYEPALKGLKANLQAYEERFRQAHVNAPLRKDIRKQWEALRALTRDIDQALNLERSGDSSAALRAFRGVNAYFEWQGQKAPFLVVDEKWIAGAGRAQIEELARLNTDSVRNGLLFSLGRQNQDFVSVFMGGLGSFIGSRAFARLSEGARGHLRELSEAYGKKEASAAALERIPQKNRFPAEAALHRLRVLSNELLGASYLPSISITSPQGTRFFDGASDNPNLARFTLNPEVDVLRRDAHSTRVDLDRFFDALSGKSGAIRAVDPLGLGVLVRMKDGSFTFTAEGGARRLSVEKAKGGAYPGPGAASVYTLKDFESGFLKSEIDFSSVGPSLNGGLDRILAVKQYELAGYENDRPVLRTVQTDLVRHEQVIDDGKGRRDRFSLNDSNDNYDWNMRHEVYAEKGGEWVWTDRYFLEKAEQGESRGLYRGIHEVNEAIGEKGYEQYSGWVLGAKGGKAPEFLAHDQWYGARNPLGGEKWAHRDASAAYGRAMVRLEQGRLVDAAAFDKITAGFKRFMPSAGGDARAAGSIGNLAAWASTRDGAGRSLSSAQMSELDQLDVFFDGNLRLSHKHATLFARGNTVQGQWGMEIFDGAGDKPQLRGFMRPDGVFMTYRKQEKAYPYQGIGGWLDKQWNGEKKVVTHSFQGPDGMELLISEALEEAGGYWSWRRNGLSGWLSLSPVISPVASFAGDVVGAGAEWTLSKMGFDPVTAKMGGAFAAGVAEAAVSIGAGMALFGGINGVLTGLKVWKAVQVGWNTLQTGIGAYFIYEGAQGVRTNFQALRQSDNVDDKARAMRGLVSSAGGVILGSGLVIHGAGWVGRKLGVIKTPPPVVTGSAGAHPKAPVGGEAAPAAAPVRRGWGGVGRALANVVNPFAWERGAHRVGESLGGKARGVVSDTVGGLRSSFGRSSNPSVPAASAQSAGVPAAGGLGVDAARVAGIDRSGMAADPAKGAAPAGTDFFRLQSGSGEARPAGSADSARATPAADSTPTPAAKSSAELRQAAGEARAQADMNSERARRFDRIAEEGAGNRRDPLTESGSRRYMSGEADPKKAAQLSVEAQRDAQVNDAKANVLGKSARVMEKSEQRSQEAQRRQESADVHEKEAAQSLQGRADTYKASAEKFEKSADQRAQGRAHERQAAKMQDDFSKKEKKAQAARAEAEQASQELEAKKKEGKASDGEIKAEEVETEKLQKSADELKAQADKLLDQLKEKHAQAELSEKHAQTLEKEAALLEEAGHQLDRASEMREGGAKGAAEALEQRVAKLKQAAELSEKMRELENQGPDKQAEADSLRQQAEALEEEARDSRRPALDPLTLEISRKFQAFKGKWLDGPSGFFKKIFWDIPSRASKGLYEKSSAKLAQWKEKSANSKWAEGDGFAQKTVQWFKGWGTPAAKVVWTIAKGPFRLVRFVGGSLLHGAVIWPLKAGYTVLVRVPGWVIRKAAPGTYWGTLALADRMGLTRVAGLRWMEADLHTLRAREAVDLQLRIREMLREVYGSKGLLERRRAAKTKDPALEKRLREIMGDLDESGGPKARGQEGKLGKARRRLRELRKGSKMSAEEFRRRVREEEERRAKVKEEEAGKAKEVATPETGWKKWSRRILRGAGLAGLAAWIFRSYIKDWFDKRKPADLKESGGNQAPEVSVPETLDVEWPKDGGKVTADIRGKVTDDGLPEQPGQVSVTWSLQEGETPVDFSVSETAGDARNEGLSIETEVTVYKPGTYYIQVTANDGNEKTVAFVELNANPDNTPSQFEEPPAERNGQPAAGSPADSGGGAPPAGGGGPPAGGGGAPGGGMGGAPPQQGGSPGGGGGAPGGGGPAKGAGGGGPAATDTPQPAGAAAAPVLVQPPLVSSGYTPMIIDAPRPSFPRNPAGGPGRDRTPSMGGGNPGAGPFGQNTPSASGGGTSGGGGSSGLPDMGPFNPSRPAPGRRARPLPQPPMRPALAPALRDSVAAAGPEQKPDDSLMKTFLRPAQEIRSGPGANKNEPAQNNKDLLYFLLQIAALGSAIWLFRYSQLARLMGLAPRKRREKSSK